MKLAIILMTLLVSMPLRAQGELNRIEEVHYVSNHDPGWIVLEAEREIRVRWAVPGSLSIDEVNNWRGGKLLSIAFSSKTGPVLFDPDSGRSIPIIGGLEKHPIDLIVDKCFESELSTQGMVGCYVRGQQLWDGEINRLYDLLMNSLKGKQKNSVQVAQQLWKKYRNAHTQAVSAVYTEGTIAFISRAGEMMRLEKEQAQRLERWASEK